MKKNDWKKREGVVYSTDPGFSFQYSQKDESTTPGPSKQNLVVSLDKSMRAGKQVTLVEGFVGTSADLDALTKDLKTACGAGGSSKDGVILIQGDKRDNIVRILGEKGFRARKR